MSKAMLVVNPTAGNESAPHFKKDFSKKLEEHFEHVDVIETEYEGHIEELAEKACEEDYEGFFVMGGDGSVSEAIAGLAEKDNQPKFGFIPMGTVNDLARALEIPLNPAEAIESMDFNRTVKLDVGKVNDRYFSNMLAAGTFAKSVKETSIEDKSKFGKLAYVINGFRELQNNKPLKYEVILDGETFNIETSLLAVTVSGAMSTFGDFFKNIDPSNGKLAIFYTKDKSVIDMIMGIPEALDGVDSETEHLGYREFETASIKLKSEGDSSLTIDGDDGPDFPLEIKVLKGEIEVYK